MNRIDRKDVFTAYPVSEWHEDEGSVLWWRFPVEEPPEVASGLQDDFDKSDFTHWSRIT